MESHSDRLRKEVKRLNGVQAILTDLSPELDAKTWKKLLDARNGLQECVAYLNQIADKLEEEL